MPTSLIGYLRPLASLIGPLRPQGIGASGTVGSEHGLSREIRKHAVPRHVQAGAIDKFLNLGFVDRRDWKVDALDKEALRRKVVNVVEVQQRLKKVFEEQGKKNLRICLEKPCLEPTGPLIPRPPTRECHAFPPAKLPSTRASSHASSAHKCRSTRAN